jgi:hypothetical protein
MQNFSYFFGNVASKFYLKMFVFKNFPFSFLIFYTNLFNFIKSYP